MTLPGLFRAGIDWLTGRKSEPSIRDGLSSIAGYDPAYSDIWRATRAPTRSELIASYKEIVYACANLNSQTCAANTLHLYVTTGPGQSRAKCEKRPVSRKTLEYLKKNRWISDVVRKSEVEEVLDHPLLNLLKNVNSELDSFSLQEFTFLYLEICGNAFWYLPKNNLGIPEAIWILPAHYVQPVHVAGSLNIVDYYQYGQSTGGIKYPPEEIIHFKMPNLRNPYFEGLSPVRAAYESINLIGMDKSHASALLNNSARPDMLVSPKEASEPIGDAVVQRLEKQLNKKFRQKGSGGIMVSGDALDFKPLAFNPRDLEALARSKATRMDVANVFGIPISLLETNSVNLANLEAAMVLHARTAILPRLTRHEQRLTQQFASRFDSRLFFAYDNPVPEDKQKSVAVAKEQIAMGVLTINEDRLENGRASVPWGDEPWLPNSLIQPSTPRPEPVSPFGQAPNFSEPEKIKPEKAYSVLSDYFCGRITRKAAMESLQSFGVKEKTTSSWTEKTQLRERVCCKEKNQDLEKHLPRVKQIAEILKRFFRAQKIKVLGSVKSFKEWTPPPEYLDTIDLSSWDKKMAHEVRPLVEMTYLKGGNDFILRQSLSDLANTWNITNPKVREAINRLALDFCKETNATTSLQLKEALSKLREDLASGLFGEENTPAELTRRVNAIFDQAEAYRAERIALTESSRALHDGEREAAVESGVVKGFKWLASDDACPECLRIAAANPDGIGLDGSFAEGTGEGSYGGDIRYPPAHPYCMCTMTEILTED